MVHVRLLTVAATLAGRLRRLGRRRRPDRVRRSRLAGYWQQARAAWDGPCRRYDDGHIGDPQT